MACEIKDKDEWIVRILNGEATPGELRDLSEWLENPENEAYFGQWRKLWNLTSGPSASAEQVEAEWEHFRNYIREEGRQKAIRRPSAFRRVAAWAAVLLLPLTLGVYLFLHTEKPTVSPGVEEMAGVPPGQSKAVLRTADGREVALGSGGPSQLEVAKDAFVRDNGSVVVYADSAQQPGKVQYNHLTVPRGGEYQIVLSDGTEVYLNSASGLKYPVAFGQDERTVYLSGEAYFKVKKDKARPFVVCVNSVKIQVYGTSFNVNTHRAGSIQTVLVEGSVGISGKGAEYRLKPSQLAEFTQDGTLKQIREVDVKPYVAWRQGLFLFEDQGLEEIMHTLSLWYDVDVFYASEEVKKYHFTGYMQRYEEIGRILNAISKMVGVQFKINGKTIVVSK